MNKNLSLIIFLLISSSISLSSPLGYLGVGKNPKSIEFSLGYGFYEAINAGIKYNFNNQDKIGISFGMDNYIINREKYYSIIFEYDCAILKRKKTNNQNYKWFWNNKLIYWHLEDDYYKWNVISICLSLNRNIYINDKIFISIDAGPIFNIVLRNIRKTFDEVGWPYHVMPNFRLLLNY